mmetsp:Transcript_9612/g.12698  ORF Transcript_9612/g.12698 Transcript_9612/m.12698 type:complete len:238 (+) Transcript_9612:893-1606(+)
MRKTKMCCFLLITFSVSPRPVLRCPHFLDVFLPLSVTSPLLPQTWVLFKNVLPPPPRDPSPLCKLFMCRLMILQILHPPPLLLTWMPQLCCLVPLLSWVFTPLSILLTLLLECSTPVLLDKIIMILLVPPKNFFRITSLCKISLLFLVWMNSLKMISLPLHALVKSKSSCLNLSTWPKFSLVPRVSSSHWLKPSRDSAKSLKESTMTCPKVHFTWLETLRTSRLRPPVWSFNLPQSL